MPSTRVFCYRSSLRGPKLLSPVLQLALLVMKAVAEIVGCYLPYLSVKNAGSPWLLPLASLALALF